MDDFLAGNYRADLEEVLSDGCLGTEPPSGNLLI